MLLTPNRIWPTHKLAVPSNGHDPSVRFDTPIGMIYSQTSNRRNLGLLVFEELCAFYERGAVRIRPGDIVVDLGANVGTFTRFALNRGAAKVIAVEPEPSHAACLRRTFDRELRAGSVFVVESAAWHEEGYASFKCDGVGSQISDSGSVRVALTTVDKLVRELSLDRVDFIKANIEGAERHALVGAADAIRRFTPRMALCINHLIDDARVIPEVVKSIRPYSVSFNAAREQAFFSPTRLPMADL